MRVLVLAVLLLVQSATAQDFHGKSYQLQPGSQKSILLMNGVTGNTKSNSYPSKAQQAELFIESMDLSFNTVADDMPKQFLGLQTRMKLVHSVGAVGVVNWAPVPNRLNYTGIFASGARNAIIRFSSGAQPIRNGTSFGVGGFVPGIAIKFLRNGVHSANLFSLNSVGLAGQTDCNFFAHDWSNHAPELSSSAPFALKLVRSTFAKASDYPTYLGLLPLAQYDSSGKLATKPRFPWRLVIHPTTQVHNAFPSTCSSVPFEQQLSNGLTRGPLFSVYAIDSPINDRNVGTAVLIARISLTSPVTTSMFGDKTLFFQHASLEGDFVVRPDWQSTADQIQAAQRNSIYPISYPDLPWN